MTDYARIERRLTDVLRLSRRPVAIAFRDTPPEGVLQLSGSQPSGCSFWRLAAGGQVFYTVPSDHYNCPVGSYTHNIALPPEREAELNGTLGLMVDIGYIKMEEVPGIPRLHEAATRAAKQVLPLLGRPTCMAIPAALSGGVASSLGCIGNRVYTGIADDQFYTVIAGADLNAILGELDTIVTANATLAEYHQGRRATLASA